MPSERGSARSDIAPMIMCGASGVREMKSQKVSCAAGLRKTAVGLHFYRVHQVRKFHCILDEEHRDVVADQIPVARLGIELHRKTAQVARRIHRTGATGDRRKARKHRGALVGALKNVGLAEVGERLIKFKKAVRRRAARMHDALGNALVVEVEDFFAQREIFAQRGPRAPDFSWFWLSAMRTP